MAIHDPSSDKATLRRDARARRDAISDEVRHAAALAAAQVASRSVLPILAPGAVIGLYASMRSELSTAPLAALAAARRIELAYPRTAADHTLVFHKVAVEDAAALAAGRFGIPEPSPDAEIIPLEQLAAIVVPALLFDRSGYRLGWGGGWYDATLPRTHAFRIGYALEAQLVDALPRAPHDEPVDVIVTELAMHQGAKRWTR